MNVLGLQVRSRVLPLQPAYQRSLIQDLKDDNNNWQDSDIDQR
jgi:hypothetical protein